MARDNASWHLVRAGPGMCLNVVMRDAKMVLIEVGKLLIPGVMCTEAGAVVDVVFLPEAASSSFSRPRGAGVAGS